MLTTTAVDMSSSIIFKILDFPSLHEFQLLMLVSGCLSTAQRPCVKSPRSLKNQLLFRGLV